MPLKLQRLTWLQIAPATDRWSSEELVVDGVVIRFGKPLPIENGGPQQAGVTRRLFVAEVRLAALPESSPAVQVPEAERLLAERVLEDPADALAVVGGSQRSLFSPSGLAVSFYPETVAERQWLLGNFSAVNAKVAGKVRDGGKKARGEVRVRARNAVDSPCDTRARKWKAS